MSMSVTPEASRLRLAVLGVVVLSLFAAMLARLWYLQVLAAPTYRTEAQQNRVRIVVTEAPRGRILDRHGRVLVGNRVVSAVVVSREAVADDPGVLARLSPLLGVSEPELARRVADERFSPFKPVPVAVDVPKEKLIHIREHQGEFPGVEGVQLTQRTYPNGPTAAHVLGYVGEINDKELEPRKAQGYKAGDTIGKSGLELTFEEELRGEPEIEKLEVDAEGRVLRSLGKQPAVQGNDIRLTIDLDIQKLAEESLVQGLEAARKTYDGDQAKFFIAPAGSVVVLDPRDGAVRAMASYPWYDPSEFVNGIREQRFAELNDPNGGYPLTNRAIQGLYAPASTFKLATALAALDASLITPSYVLNDTGSFRIGNEVRRNAGGAVFGPVDVARALTVSSDVFFYDLGARFCPGRCSTSIQDTARSLGLGNYTEVELPFEADGRIADPENRRRLHEANPEAFPEGDWYTGDNVNVAIGQGETVVTPIQLATAYATFANGGSVHVPRLAGAVQDRHGTEVRRIEPRTLRTIDLPPSLRQPILRGLEGVVTADKGTATAAFAGFPHDRFRVAAKTGTAQAPPKQDTALFAAFGPVENPQYTISVVMEEAGFGASSAAPVARRIFDGVLGLPVAPVATAVGGLD
jgi:penicillin-binding protein 2